MGISLIVTRAYTRDFQETGQEIVLEDWLRLVDEDPNLRLRTEPFTAVNPETGEVLSLPAGVAQAEIKLDEHFVPFLGYRSGELVMEYVSDFEDPNNPVRRKIADVAARLGALVAHDAGDEILEW